MKLRDEHQSSTQLEKDVLQLNNKEKASNSKNLIEKQTIRRNRANIHTEELSERPFVKENVQTLSKQETLGSD